MKNDAQMMIQLGHPKIERGPFPMFKTVNTVFLELFRVEEESSYLFWNDIPIRLRYREELFHNFDAILALVWLIQRDEQGTTKATLLTQLVTIDWKVRWQINDITIHSVFTPVDDLYEPYAQALNHVPVLSMEKHTFLGEWRTLLHQIILSFQAGQIQIEDGTERRKLELLQRVDKQIPSYGRLYTQPE